jgi:hypothetical protein
VKQEAAGQWREAAGQWREAAGEGEADKIPKIFQIFDLASCGWGGKQWQCRRIFDRQRVGWVGAIQYLDKISDFFFGRWEII